MTRNILLLSLLALVSCQKGVDSITPSFDQSLVAGTWKLQSLTVDPGETGALGANVTDLLAAYQQQIGDSCMDSFRMNMTASGKITRTTSDLCNAKTLTLFGFAENGTWKAASSTMHVQSAYEAADYYSVTVDQQTMTWHRHVDLTDSPDNKTHEATLVWIRQ